MTEDNNQAKPEDAAPAAEKKSIKNMLITTGSIIAVMAALAGFLADGMSIYTKVTGEDEVVQKNAAAALPTSSALAATKALVPKIAPAPRAVTPTPAPVAAVTPKPPPKPAKVTIKRTDGNRTIHQGRSKPKFRVRAYGEDGAEIKTRTHLKIKTPSGRTTRKLSVKQSGTYRVYGCAGELCSPKAITFKVKSTDF